MSKTKIVQRVKHLIQGLARCHAHQEHPPKGYKGPRFGPEETKMTKKELRRAREFGLAQPISRRTGYGARTATTIGTRERGRERNVPSNPGHTDVQAP